jgi:hypothetical protein
MRKITLGCDPELFLENENGEIVSAEGLIGGTKKAPKYITTDGHAIQEDNIMVEFNIPPSSTCADFINNIKYVKNYLNNIFKNQNLKLNYSASAILDKKYLNTNQARMFGCEPDFNVYLKAQNNKPNSDTRLRSCGGHVHCGYPNENQNDTENIVKAMDIYLGLPSVWLDPDIRRRRMYGMAGSFRFKDYGLEYRTLSNFWVQNDELIKFVYDNALLAIKTAFSEKSMLIINELSTEIQEAINESNVELAKSLYRQTINKIEKITKKINKCVE